jgi:hypothetical protein
VRIDELHAVLHSTVRDLPDGDLVPALGALASTSAELTRRLVTAAAMAVPVQLVEVAEAAAAARLPRRRVYSLARSAGATWCVRVSSRRVLVDLPRFLAALASDVRGGHESHMSGRPVRGRCIQQARSAREGRLAGLDTPGSMKT